MEEYGPNPVFIQTLMKNGTCKFNIAAMWQMIGKPFRTLLSSPAQKKEKSRINLSQNIRPLGGHSAVCIDQKSTPPALGNESTSVEGLTRYTSLQTPLPRPACAATIYSCCSPVICSHVLLIGIGELSLTRYVRMREVVTVQFPARSTSCIATQHRHAYLRHAERTLAIGLSSARAQQR